MANLKAKPKSLKEAMTKANLVDEEELLSPKIKGVPKELEMLDGKSVKELQAALEQRSEVIEEEAKLKARLEEIARDKKALEVQLRKLGDHHPAMKTDDSELEFDLGGMHVKIGKKGTKRELTDEGKKKLLDLLTSEDLFKLANFKLGDLDDYLTAKQRDQVLQTSRSDRSVKAEPLTK